ncbi:unnamed protein product [Nippostrongylus brasiliensis]|uniref:Uncharacterized protein n=1 Tax=Nippostrongylus brasiliensis TaxID=27835 RepID=A0A0N4YWC3_NIPBR|nr:unnamed protein product [Nippostrongylus brasiliensis]
MLGEISSTGVTCVNELGRSLRTDDPRRELVGAAVRERTALVKEIVKAALLDIDNLSMKRRAYAWLHYCENGEATEVLGCAEREVTANVRGLVEQLSREVERLDHGKEESSCQAEWPGRLDLESIAPEVLREFAGRKLRERGQHATIIGQGPTQEACERVKEVASESFWCHSSAPFRLLIGGHGIDVSAIPFSLGVSSSQKVTYYFHFTITSYPNGNGSVPRVRHGCSFAIQTRHRSTQQAMYRAHGGQ